MRKFDMVRSITGVEEFSRLVFSLAHEVKEPSEFAAVMAQEFTEEQLQTVMSVAESGNYPLNLNDL